MNTEANDAFLGQLEDTSVVENDEGLDIGGQMESARAEDQGTDVHLKGIDGSYLFFNNSGVREKVVIRMAGVHSTICKNFDREVRNRKLKPGAMTTQTFYDENIERAAACTLGWKGIRNKGEDVRFDIKNAAVLYKSLPWILDQVLEAMNDHSLFTKTSSNPQ